MLSHCQQLLFQSGQLGLNLLVLQGIRTEILQQPQNAIVCDTRILVITDYRLLNARHIRGIHEGESNVEIIKHELDADIVCIRAGRIHGLLLLNLKAVQRVGFLLKRPAGQTNEQTSRQYMQEVVAVSGRLTNTRATQSEALALSLRSLDEENTTAGISLISRSALNVSKNSKPLMLGIFN